MAGGAGTPDAGNAGAGGAAPGDASVCPSCDACANGVQDEAETGVDCGGPCAACGCTWSPFGVPEPVSVSGLAAGSSLFGPALSSDGMTLFFSAQSTGTQDLYASSRSEHGNVFGAATNALFATIATAASETKPRVSVDGLRLYFTSDFVGPLATGGADLYLSTRSSTTGTFPIPAAMSGINSTALDSLAWISPDELQIYFSSARTSSPGGMNLWFAKRSARAATFGSPQTLSELNTDANEQGASLSPDQLTIFFASDRVGADSAGKYDLWMATRATTASPFGAPALVPNVNSSADEIDVSVSADGTELFFSSDRAGTEHTVWRSTRNCQ